LWCCVWRCLTTVSKQQLVTECLHAIGLITHELLMNFRKRFRALIKLIISHVRLFIIISHVKIIAFQKSLFCKNYRFSKTILYVINRRIHGCLEIPDLFLVLNTCYLTHVRCAHLWDIMLNTRNKYGVCAHPCIIL
jgi:hypothetical protein